jgi:putative nucleotidyltransferase with HDIG domain
MFVALFSAARRENCIFLFVNRSRIADITKNAEDMQTFGKLLHGVTTELLGAEMLLIGAVDQNNDIVWNYEGGILSCGLPKARDGSFLSEMIYTDAPFLIGQGDIFRLSERDEFSAECGMAVIASAPFTAQGKREGTIIIGCRQCSKEEEARVLNTVVFIARQMGTIYERRQMQEVLTRSRDELEEAVRKRTDEIVKANQLLTKEIKMREESERLKTAILSITDCASDTLDPQEICKEIHAITGSIIYAPNFSLALVDDGNMTLTPVYFSDERGLKSPDDSRFFTSMNRYILGTQNPANFSRASMPAALKESANGVDLPESWLGVPLRMGGPPFGVVSVHSYAPERIYGEKEMDALVSIAPQIASTIERSITHGKLRRYQTELETRVEARTRDLREANQSLQTIINLTVDVLSSASEIRDPYTAGHQKRVTDIAVKIAQQMNLPTDQIESIRIAGTLHDFGKISVPIEILSKPGQLTSLETQFIHTHSQTGYDILRIIPFKGPIADIVHQHHEKLDGSGYPMGIAGDEICLEARILTIADIVEAISSHRPYRPSLGMEAAIKEISDNSGTLYDPEVVKACIAIIDTL